MIEEKSNQVLLPGLSLCGIQSMLSYRQYHPEFSGRYDAAGNPIFVRQETPRLVPVIRPTPGHVFFGTWLPHEDLPVIVLDTPGLRVGLESPLAHHNPASLTDRPRLLAVAVHVPDPVLGQRLVWNIYERQGSDISDCLTPEVEQVALPNRHYNGFSVPVAQAVDYQAEEILQYTQQRREINPWQEPHLSAVTARGLAAEEVFGPSWPPAIDARNMHSGLLRNLELYLTQARPKERSELEADIAAVRADPAGYGILNSTWRLMDLHPLLDQAVSRRADEMLAKDLTMANGLANLHLRRDKYLMQCRKLADTHRVGQALTAHPPAPSVHPAQPPAHVTPPPPKQKAQATSPPAKGMRLRF